MQGKLDASKVTFESGGTAYIKILSGDFPKFNIPSEYGTWWKVIEFGKSDEYVQIGVSYTDPPIAMVIRAYQAGSYTDWVRV